MINEWNWEIQLCMNKKAKKHVAFTSMRVEACSLQAIGTQHKKQKKIMTMKIAKQPQQQSSQLAMRVSQWLKINYAEVSENLASRSSAKEASWLMLPALTIILAEHHRGHFIMTNCLIKSHDFPISKPTMKMLSQASSSYFDIVLFSSWVSCCKSKYHFCDFPPLDLRLSAGHAGRPIKDQWRCFLAASPKTPPTLRLVSSVAQLLLRGYFRLQAPQKALQSHCHLWETWCCWKFFWRN